MPIRTNKGVPAPAAKPNDNPGNVKKAATEESDSDASVLTHSAPFQTFDPFEHQPKSFDPFEHQPKTFDPFEGPLASLSEGPPAGIPLADAAPIVQDDDDDEEEDVLDNPPMRSWASFDPFDAAQPGMGHNAAKTSADGPPPGIMSAASQPMHVGGKAVVRSAPAMPPGVQAGPPGVQAGPSGAADYYPPGVNPGFMPLGMQYYAGIPQQASREEVDALLLEKAALEAENAALRAHMALEAERAGAMAAMAGGLHAQTVAAAVQGASTKPGTKKKKEAKAKVPDPKADGEQAKADEPKADAVEVVADETFQTLMLRNLPSAHGFSRDALMGLLDREGFKEKYDFIYAPIDFHTERLMGFAFINCVSHSEALRAKQHLDGFTDWGVQSKKVCEVRWGDPNMQGLPANIEHYRNSPVMHESVPEMYRPLVLAEGVAQSFAPPTKKVRAPRLRHSGARKQ